MKKIVSLLLAVFMMASFAACGETPSAPTDGGTAQNTESDAAYIQQKGEMNIGITLFNPMNYYDEQNNLTGFETEFATAVCEELGLKPNFVEINWDSKEIELNAKNIDCIWNGMTITDERMQTMSISEPYMVNRQVLITKKENAQKYAESVDGANVVAEQGSDGETLVNEDPYFANVNYTPVDAQTKGLLEVVSGISDIAVCDYVLSIGSIGEGTDYEELAMVDGKAFSPKNYGVAFRKGSDMTEKVNEAIHKLAQEGKLLEIAEKYKLQEQLLIKE